MLPMPYVLDEAAVAVPSAQVSAHQQKDAAASKRHTLDDLFHISLYKPNYLLPGYYSTSPYEAVYAGHTPDNQRIAHTDVKFQLSLKVPVLSNIEGWPLTLYGAYTQLSYWQAYDKSAFFRESNYEPSVFFRYAWQKTLPAGWRWKWVDFGAEHQSNGRGGQLERSWNRVYLSSSFSHEAWTVDLDAWYPLHDASMVDHNPDIAHYLGYGQWIVSYHFGEHRQQTLSFLSRNNLTSGFSRGAEELTWSFPLVQALKGYLQIFSGYGQSLIEYNHRTEAIGVGITLNDW